MAYTNQTQDPRRRVTAVAGVAVVHTAIALALLSLGIVGNQELGTRLTGVTLTPDPKPKPPAPPEPRDPSPAQQNRTVSPPLPPIQWPHDPPTQSFIEDPIVDATWPLGENTLVPPVPTPRPGLGFAPKGAAPTNRPSGWISTDDYPARPLRDEVEGLAGYRLIVGSNGQVSSCEVTRSAGNNDLDQATCRLIARRARFEAATDENGAKVVGSYSGTVRWEIPD